MGKFVSICAKSSIFGILLLLLCQNISAGTKYSFSRHQNTIPTIVEYLSQDSLGRLWIGTWNGLYRYDGEDFYNFKNQVNEAQGELSPSYRYDIVEPDAYGGVWILGNDKSIYYFDELKESIIRFNDSSYKNIFKLSSSDFFFITEDNEVFRSHYYENRQISFIKFSEFDSDVTVNGIYQDSNEAIWVYTDKGIYKDNVLKSELPGFCCEEYDGAIYFGSEKGKIVEYLDDKVIIFESVIKRDIRTIVHTQQDRELIVGSTEEGLFVLDNSKWELDKLTGNHYHEGEWVPVKDKKGNLWLYSKQGSLNKYDPEKRALVPFYNANLQQEWDSEVNVNTILVDAQNNIWIGGSWRGLEKAVPNSGEFKIKEVASEEAGPEQRSTRAIIQTHRRNIIVSTKDGGIHLFDKDLKELRKWNIEHPVYDICQDEEGTIWMASKEGGILEVPRDFNIQSYDLNYKRYVKGIDYYSPIGNKAYCVQPDGSGRLWLAYFDESVSFINISDSERRFISKKNMISFPTAYQNRTRFICFGEKGEMYACGQLGIHICKNPGATAKELEFLPIECVEGKDIQHLIIKNSNEMYASSFGHGFLHLTKKGDTWSAESYSLEDGLLSNYILSAIQDKEGNIWIATYGGLNKFFPESGIIINYTPDRLGYNLSFNEGEPIMDEEGKIYFNTNAGLLYFDPLKISKDSYIPHIYVKNCYINGKRIYLDKDKPVIKARRSNRLVIDFNSIDMTNPERVNYFYRLGNKDWIQMGNNSTVTIDKLPPGKHKLELKSTNGEGYEVNNNYQIELSVTIDVIYIILFVLLCLALCTLAVFFFTKKEKKEERDEDTDKELFIEKFNSYIEQNMDNANLGISEIAGEFGMSRSTFYNKVNEYMGQAPAEYIRSIRMKKACELLNSKNLSVGQIAYMTGFNDPHYFGKAFKKEFGITPSEYRKR